MYASSDVMFVLIELALIRKQNVLLKHGIIQSYTEV